MRLDIIDVGQGATLDSMSGFGTYHGDDGVFVARRVAEIIGGGFTIYSVFKEMEIRHGRGGHCYSNAKLARFFKKKNAMEARAQMPALLQTGDVCEVSFDIGLKDALRSERIINMNLNDQTYELKGHLREGQSRLFLIGRAFDLYLFAEVFPEPCVVPEFNMRGVDSSTRPICISVQGCQRCGQDHPSVYFRPLLNPDDELGNSHWGECPNTKQPILLQRLDTGIFSPLEFIHMTDPKRVRGEIVCLDFDGVIHSYASGWDGADKVNDPPVDGALQAIQGYIDAGLTVCIYSSRSNQLGGIAAMAEWLLKHGMPRSCIVGNICWPMSKPPAKVSVDDRALAFDGAFPSAEEIKSFKPWNKRDKKWTAGTGG